MREFYNLDVHAESVKRKLIIISGPTSVGKTYTAVETALRLDGEVVSADSMQVYRGLDIGTAKITEEEKKGVRHHLIDVLDADQEFNASLFRDMADRAIEDICARGKIPIICGGTGFYIKTLLYFNDSRPPGKDPEYRDELRMKADSGCLEQLYGELKDADPAYSEKIHRNDRSRIIRALEYIHATGNRYSEYCSESTDAEPRYDFVHFLLDCDRWGLFERIDSRVDWMVANGLKKEVEDMVSRGIDRSYTSMNGIGYKEMYGHVIGETSFEDAVRTIKTNTHRYAVRQLTWFNNIPGIHWIDMDCDDAVDRIVKISSDALGIGGD